MDERFVMHRYKSTSHAAVVAGLLMGGWYFYDWLANDYIRRDFVVVMVVMAAVKVGAMLYYRLRD